MKKMIESGFHLQSRCFPDPIIDFFVYMIDFFDRISELIQCACLAVLLDKFLKMHCHRGQITVLHP